MTRSIFDPDSGETERSGSRNLGPAAGNISHMPPDVVDGEAEPEEVTSEGEVDAQSADVNRVALTDEEAAKRLKEMEDNPTDLGETNINS